MASGYPGQDTLKRLQAGGSAPASSSGYAGQATLARLRGGTAPAAKKKPQPAGGGLFGTLERIVPQTGSDLYHAAVNLPAGIAYLAKAPTLAAYYLATGQHEKAAQNAQQAHDALVSGLAAQVKQDVQHPLRHPGYTGLDVLSVAAPAASGAARVGAAGRVAAEGGRVADVARALTAAPEIAPRALTSGGLTVNPETSRSVLGASMQKATDAAIQKVAGREPATRTGTFVQRAGEARLNKRIGKVVSTQARMQTQIAKGPGQALIAIGKKLSPGEQKALQVVAEQAPIDQRITAASARVVGAKTTRRGRASRRNSICSIRRSSIWPSRTGSRCSWIRGCRRCTAGWRRSRATRDVAEVAGGVDGRGDPGADDEGGADRDRREVRGADAGKARSPVPGASQGPRV